MDLNQELIRLAESGQAIKAARHAVEDAAYAMRAGGISAFGHTTGVVIASDDGRASSIVRLTVEDAVKIALRALTREVQRTP